MGYSGRYDGGAAVNPYLLPLLGLFSAGTGTLVGAGGGFILVPILLALLPQESPGIITGISQTVVLLNTLSGSVAYVWQRRIAYRWVALLVPGGLLGMAVGAAITERLSRRGFESVFGVVFLFLALYLFLRPVRPGAARSLQEAQARRPSLSARHVPLVALLGFGVGSLGGLLGIGGGIVLVPILVQLLDFPAHIATATSELFILLTSPSAIAVHAVSVALTERVTTALLLGVGAILGAQVGARLSRRVSGPLLVRILAVALAAVAVRLLVAVL